MHGNPLRPRCHGQKCDFAGGIKAQAEEEAHGIPDARMTWGGTTANVGYTEGPQTLGEKMLVDLRAGQNFHEKQVNSEGRDCRCGCWMWLVLCSHPPCNTIRDEQEPLGRWPLIQTAAKFSHCRKLQSSILVPKPLNTELSRHICMRGSICQEEVIPVNKLGQQVIHSPATACSCSPYPQLRSCRQADEAEHMI